MCRRRAQASPGFFRIKLESYPVIHVALANANAQASVRHSGRGRPRIIASEEPSTGLRLIGAIRFRLAPGHASCCAKDVLGEDPSSECSAWSISKPVWAMIGSSSHVKAECSSRTSSPGSILVGRCRPRLRTYWPATCAGSAQTSVSQLGGKVRGEPPSLPRPRRLVFGATTPLRGPEPTVIPRKPTVSL